MYFITKKNTATGKKFAALEAKMQVVTKAQKALSKELGATQWRDSYWVVMGGFSALIFPKGKEPDLKLWKNVNGSKTEWMPRYNRKASKEISNKINALPVIRNKDLNDCIGFKADIFKSIGFNPYSKDYFGFIAKEEWNIRVPKDCKEITYTQWKKIFGNE